MISTKWHIDERVNEAYQFAENRRLVRTALAARPAGASSPQRILSFQMILQWVPKHIRLGTVDK